MNILTKEVRECRREMMDRVHQAELEMHDLRVELETQHGKRLDEALPMFKEELDRVARDRAEERSRIEADFEEHRVRDAEQMKQWETRYRERLSMAQSAKVKAEHESHALEAQLQDAQRSLDLAQRDQQLLEKQLTKAHSDLSSVQETIRSLEEDKRQLQGEALRALASRAAVDMEEAGTADSLSAALAQARSTISDLRAKHLALLKERVLWRGVNVQQSRRSRKRRRKRKKRMLLSLAFSPFPTGVSLSEPFASVASPVANEAPAQPADRFETVTRVLSDDFETAENGKSFVQAGAVTERNVDVKYKKDLGAESEEEEEIYADMGIDLVVRDEEEDEEEEENEEGGRGRERRRGRGGGRKECRR